MSKNKLVPVKKYLVPRGLSVWELSLDEKLIRKAEITQVNGEDCYVFKHGCLYNAALNAQNADRKFLKRILK